MSLWPALTAAALDEACHDVGRDPAEVARSVMVPVVIGRDDAEVARAIDGQRATFATLPADLDAWIEAGFIGGSPAQVVARLAAFIDAGASSERVLAGEQPTDDQVLDLARPLVQRRDAGIA